jgi:UMF1 family MFS transporter
VRKYGRYNNDTPARPMQPSTTVEPRASRREILAWAMYDFANSGYTTVVLTAIFNAYFVGVVAGNGPGGDGRATLLWSMAMALTHALVLVSAPVIGAIADFSAAKKRFLAASTVGCVLFTAALGFVGRGDIATGMLFTVLSAFMFATGENLIASFLTEIAAPDDMGKVSGYGWSLGYLGGMAVLAVCLAYIQWAEERGHSATEFVPVTMWITAAAFALAALPTFLVLRERARPVPLPAGEHYLMIGFRRLRDTLTHARRHRDLFRFLLTLAVYYSGIYTVVVLAAVYAQEAMGFSFRDTIVLILVVNVTAALGAYGFGLLQDRFGSIPTLAATLCVWIVALLIAYFTESRTAFWVAANLIGVALGSSQSAGRALVGLFSPPARTAEFFGLWGLAGKTAAIIGPMTYGLITWLTGGNHRLALLATSAFFVVGLALLLTVDERRGREAAVAPA